MYVNPDLDISSTEIQVHAVSDLQAAHIYLVPLLLHSRKGGDLMLEGQLILHTVTVLSCALGPTVFIFQLSKELPQT